MSEQLSLTHKSAKRNLNCPAALLRTRKKINIPHRTGSMYSRCKPAIRFPMVSVPLRASIG
jgi:hypothetical protein